MTKKIESLLYEADRFIKNGQNNAPISEALASIGFVAANWTEGQSKWNEAKTAIEADGTAHAIQMGATDDFNEKFTKTWAQAQMLAKLSVLTFDGDTEKLARLGLHQKRNAATGESELAWPMDKSWAHYLYWARNLYEAIGKNAELAAVLAGMGYPEAKLTAEAADVEAAATADLAQEARKAEAQQATVVRDEQVAAIEAWLRGAKKRAKLVVKDRQLLEMLGMGVRR
jgi:hypothetical protein